MEDKSKTKPTRRRILKTFSLLGLGGLGCIADAFLIEPELSFVTEKTITLDPKFAHLDGLRIVQLTDIHYHPTEDESLIDKIIEKTNALNADLILLTGDFLEGSERTIPNIAGKLGKLRAKFGVLASMGNHDIWHTSIYTLRDEFKKYEIPVLCNQHTRIALPNGGDLIVGALDSAWGGSPSIDQMTRGLQKNDSLLSMVHEPDLFDQVCKQSPTFLQLSGHTHGGQCRVPLIGYAPTTVKYGKKYVYGHFSQERSQLFVSRGIGTTGLRVRFACPPEIALFTLRSSA